MLDFIKDNRQYIFVTLIVMVMTRWVIKKVQNRPPGYVNVLTHTTPIFRNAKRAFYDTNTDRWRFPLSVIFPISVHLEDLCTRSCTSWLKNMVMWCLFGSVTSTPSSCRITNTFTRRWKRKVISSFVSFFFHVTTLVINSQTSVCRWSFCWTFPSAIHEHHHSRSRCCASGRFDAMA